MERKADPQMDDLARSIGELAKTLDPLAHRAQQQYASEVENVLRIQCRDPNRIERLLDGLLDFCFDPEILRLFKKIARYYFQINPVAAKEYVNTYREMWDSEL
jgi:hypothetical protein